MTLTSGLHDASVSSKGPMAENLPFRLCRAAVPLPAVPVVAMTTIALFSRRGRSSNTRYRSETVGSIALIQCTEAGQLHYLLVATAGPPRTKSRGLCPLHRLNAREKLA